MIIVCWSPARLTARSRPAAPISSLRLCWRKGTGFPAFFYREGVLNANQLTAPASDEFDLVRGWTQLAQQHGVALNVCVAAALRRGVTDEQEAAQQGLASANLQPGFTLSGLGSLAEASLSCDRLVQF